MDSRKFPTDWSYPFKAVDLLAFDDLTESDYKGINFTEQINNTAAEIDNLTSDVFYTDKWTKLTTDPTKAEYVKRQLVFKAFQFLFKYNVNFQQKWLGKGNISASLGDASVARQFDQERPPSVNLFVTNLLNKAGFYTPMTSIEVRGNQPNDDIYGTNGAMRYLPIGGSPPRSNDSVDRKWVEDNFLRPNSISQIHGTHTLQINDEYNPPKVELAVKNSGKTANIIGAEGITVTEPDRTTWKISGKTLQDRVTAHGRDIATNRALANTNTQHLLKRTPGGESVTEIKAGTNIAFDYAADPSDNTKGTVTVNARPLEMGSTKLPVTKIDSGTNITFGYGSGILTVNSSGGGGITTLTGSNGISVTGTGNTRDISGKALADKIALLKPLETGSGDAVQVIHSGQNVTFGYVSGDLTVNAIILELEDGTSTKKVIKKIKAGTNVTFALAKNVLTVNSSGGSMSEAAFADMFKKVVGASNPELLRVIKIGSRITLNTEFSHNQIFSHRSTYSKTVFPDVSEIEISTAGRTDKAQYFNFKRKYDNQFLKLGFFAYGQGWKAGLDVSHGEDFFPGKGHALGTIKALVTDDHRSGFHTSAVTVFQRKIRAGSDHQKSLTPEGVKSNVEEERLVVLERKLSKLERILKIKL